MSILLPASLVLPRWVTVLYGGESLNRAEALRHSLLLIASLVPVLLIYVATGSASYALFAYLWHWLPWVCWSKAYRKRPTVMIVEPTLFVVSVAYSWTLLDWSVETICLYTLLQWALLFAIPEGGIRRFRAAPFWRAFWHKWLRYDYFPPPSTDGPTLYACFPHGVATLATIATFALPGVREEKSSKPTVIAATPALSAIPLLGWLLRLGGMVSCSKENLVSLARGKAHNVALLPEGLDGLLGSGRNPVPPHLFVKHNGFLKLAYEERVLVVPVYYHGEHAQVWRSSESLFPGLKAFVAFCRRIFHFMPLLVVGIFIGAGRKLSLWPAYGAPLDPRRFDNFASFENAFFNELERLLPSHLTIKRHGYLEEQK